MDGNPRSTRLKHRKDNNSNAVGETGGCQSILLLL